MPKMDNNIEDDDHSVGTAVDDTCIVLETDKVVTPIELVSNESPDTAGTVSTCNMVSKNCMDTGKDIGINDICIKRDPADSCISTSDSKQAHDNSSNGDITLEQVKLVNSADKMEGSAEVDIKIEIDETPSVDNVNQLIISKENDTSVTDDVDKPEETVKNEVDAIGDDGTADQGLMEYRSKDNTITVDDTSDSSPDSSDSEDNDKDDKVNVNETTETQINKIMSEQREETPEQERRVKLNRHGFEDLKTKGELQPEDLPPLEELTITVDESVVMVEVGNVMSIVGILVVIKSNEGVPPLNDDTILFMEGHVVIGQIFEVFGPVKTPWYSVRFNEVDNIASKGLSVGMPVYYAPRENSFTKLVFVDNLRHIRGSDASWEDNNEPPEKHLDYSDDEAERKAKAKRRNKTVDADDDVEGNKKDDENGAEMKRRRNRKRSRGHQGVGSSLLENNACWNPFKDGNRTWNNAAGANTGSFQSWPPNQSRFNRPRFDNTTSNNRPRFGHVTPIGGLNQQSYVGQFNMNSGWAGAKQDGSFNSQQPGNRMNTSGGASMFTGQNQCGQVGFDVTRPPPSLMDSSIRPSNMQSFGQNLQQQRQTNVQFKPVNTSVPQNNNILTGFQGSDASNPPPNQSMNYAGIQSNTNGLMQYPPVQQNNMLNQSSIRNQSMLNNNMPMPQLCSQSMPNMNGPIQTPLNNQTRMPNSALQGQHGMMGGSNVANMAANMTQQIVQNGGFVPMMNQTNLPRSNFGFQGTMGYHDLPAATNQQPLSNQNYMNVAQMGTPQRFPPQMSNGGSGVNDGNHGNAGFTPNIQSGTNPGINMQGNIVDPRLIQNNANL